MAALGHRDEIAGNGARPNVKAEHLRSKYELSVLQQVILLQRLPSWPCNISVQVNNKERFINESKYFNQIKFDLDQKRPNGIVLYSLAVAKIKESVVHDFQHLHIQ